MTDDEAADLGERVGKAATGAMHAWGRGTGLRKLQEECGEAVAAVNQYLDGRITVEQLAGEVADVMLTCAQARVILGAVVDAQLMAKLERLEKRIEEANSAT